MSHWRSTGRNASGATTPRPSRGDTLPRSLLYPYPTRSPFARGQISQTLIDIGTIGFWALFLSLLVVGSSASIYIAFFL